MNRSIKLGQGFTIFEAFVDELYYPGPSKIGSRKVTKNECSRRSIVEYNNRNCIVVYDPINVGGRWKVQLQLITNDPTDYVEQIAVDESTLHWLNFVGIDVRRPTITGRMIGEDCWITRPTREQVLRKKFNWIDLSDFGIKELEELNEWWEDMRYKEIEEYIENDNG